MSVRKRTWKTAKGETREAWVVAYSDGNGNPHIETFARKRDAEDRHAVIKVDVGKGVHTPLNRSITVAQAANDWLTYVERRSWIASRLSSRTPGAAATLLRTSPMASSRRTSEARAGSRSGSTSRARRRYRRSWRLPLLGANARSSSRPSSPACGRANCAGCGGRTWTSIMPRCTCASAPTATTQSAARKPDQAPAPSRSVPSS